MSGNSLTAFLNSKYFISVNYKKLLFTEIILCIQNQLCQEKFSSENLGKHKKSSIIPYLRTKKLKHDMTPTDN